MERENQLDNSVNGAKEPDRMLWGESRLCRVGHLFCPNPSANLVSIRKEKLICFLAYHYLSNAADNDNRGFFNF